ncbi:MAG TPA: hypothetical protein VK608_14570 [Edaphobacter sp.]|nr:hypothetical protein [Edaphobacter sp.]
MTPYISSDESKERLQRSMKRVEKSLTPEQRVFRKMRAGRPKNLGADKPSPLQVAAQLFSEIEKTHEAMKEAKLELRELSWHLFYYAQSPSENRPRVHWWYPPPRMKTSTKDAIEFLKNFEDIENPLFLRVRWSLGKAQLVAEDEDFDSDKSADWETRFNAYPLNSAAIAAALEEEAKIK